MADVEPFGYILQKSVMEERMRNAVPRSLQSYVFPVASLLVCLYPQSNLVGGRVVEAILWTDANAIRKP